MIWCQLSLIWWNEAFLAPFTDDEFGAVIEIVHYLKCKKGGRIGEVGLKIDISKAYDHVSWVYLRAIMLKLGFAS